MNFNEILSRIPHHKYGVGEAKTIDQLKKEFDSGESIFSLDGDCVLREVWVLRARVEALHPNRKVLKAARQIMPDGRERIRDFGYYSLGEKLLPSEVDIIKGNEKSEIALVRAIHEELSLEYPRDFDISKSECTGVCREDKFSKSYPGIQCSYYFQSWQIVIEPQYIKPEYVEVCDDGSQTYFEWEIIQ